MRQYNVNPRSSGSYIEDGDTQRKAVAEKNLRECIAAIQRKPEDANLYLSRSRANESLKNYDAAIEDLSTAVRLDPQRSHFYLYLRHLLHLYRGSLHEALQDIQHAVQVAPSEFNDYFKCLAYTHQQLGQTDRAIGVLSEAVRIYPHSANSYLRRAAFYEGIGLLKEAVSDVSEAIRIEPVLWRKHHAYHDRVSLYIKLMQFDDALADCNKCIRAEPKGWTHYRIRSEVYKSMGNDEAARCDYVESMNLNPSVNR